MQAAEDAGTEIPRSRYCELLQHALKSYADYSKVAMQENGRLYMTSGGTKQDDRLIFHVEEALQKLKSLCPADYGAMLSGQTAGLPALPFLI